MKKKMIDASDLLGLLATLKDTLMAIEHVHDAHPMAYNGTIAALVDYGKEQIEQAEQDYKR